MYGRKYEETLIDDWRVANYGTENL
jgi:hypothetical protein